jgi:hypothetical protein
MLKASANLNWVSDYAQIYLIDERAKDFLAPDTVTNDDLKAGFRALGTSLVIYTMDSLCQELRIEVHDTPPAPLETEPDSARPWDKIAETVVRFPSRSLFIASPTKQIGESAGPFFKTETESCKVRMAWLEDEAERYNTERSKPDVILFQIWPNP